MRVPAQRYAVFTHQGHVSGLNGAWMRIWNEWIPQSGYRIAHTPEFERYDDRFDPKTEGGIVEIWCSIVQGGVPMIDPPEIVSTGAQQTAVIRLTIPRAEIQKVMGPAIGEVLGTVAAQGLTPTGPVFSHHFAMSPETFDFEVGVPVASTVMAFGRVRAGRVARGPRREDGVSRLVRGAGRSLERVREVDRGGRPPIGRGLLGVLRGRSRVQSGPRELADGILPAAAVTVRTAPTRRARQKRTSGAHFTTSARLLRSGSPRAVASRSSVYTTKISLPGMYSHATAGWCPPARCSSCIGGGPRRTAAASA